MANFFDNKFPYTDFHELNIDEWLLKVTNNEKKIKALEEWKFQHIEEYNQLRTLVSGFDDRIDNLEDWKVNHQAQYNQLNQLVNQINNDLSGVDDTISNLQILANNANNKADANTSRLAQAINDSIMRDQQLNQTLINLINQAAGGEFVFMNENIIAYAQELRYIPELSAMYSDDLSTGAWYIFDNLQKFTANGYHLTGGDTTNDHVMILLGNARALSYPMTISLKIDNRVYSGNIMGAALSDYSYITIGNTGEAVIKVVTGQGGAYLDIEITGLDNSYLTSLKLENGLVATPFNANTFSEYLKVFRRIIQNVIDTNIFNTEKLTITGLQCNLAVYNRADYPNNPQITNIGTASIDYQIVNSQVYGQCTVIGDPTLSIDATDTTKVYQIRVEGEAMDDLPVSSINTDVSWERTLVGSSVIRFPGAINAFYQRLKDDNTKIDFLSGLLFGILPAKGLDTTIISFGFSYPLPGNITSLDDNRF